ncbi:MAG: glycosyltransferase [Candidatus Omnitrophica bacterium]|nr:glycosyltransferase [Candidatus Omnitrophota bacterium]MBU4473306.1 glycosyltransferase [Candidatus Omnitrophota bacterium]MCG2706601.1 glycosyltransferase [Candidatus Omnitrophota bacterium]
MPGEHIILMYISEISGHHSATLAIEKAIKRLSPNIKILNINTFNYTNPISEKIVNRLYMSVIKRMPGVWDYLYDNPKVIKKIERIKKTIHKFNSPKLKNLFDRFKPRAIICTQAFPCGMVADYKKTNNSNIPLIAVLTDYIPHSYWIYDAVNYYIAPSDEVTSLLMKKGVEPDKIKTLGIPFDLKFNESIPRYKLAEKLGLNANKSTILIMGGGQGLGPLKTIIKSLEQIKGELQEIVVTGSNKRLYSSLKKRIKKYKKKILLFGHVDNINELMGIADIIITKPGGVTTAEALARKLPMIIIKPIPGQEASNTSYLTEKRAAIKIDDPKDINLVIEDLLSHPGRLKQLSEAAGRISKPNASLDIARLALDCALTYV